MPHTAPRRIRFVDRIGRPGWFVVTGVLLGLSFPPFPFAPLALIALVPMLARWSRQPSIPMLFRETYSAFLIFAACSGYWVLFHADMLKALLLGAGVLALPLVLTLPVIGSSLVARRFGLPTGIIALVCGWLALELVLTYGPVPVPWLLLGHTQAEALLVNQFADLFGVGGLTLWVLGVNLLIYGLLEARTLTPRFAMTLALAAMIVAPISYGSWRLASLPPAVDTFRVAVVQPVMPNTDWSAIASAERIQVLADMADAELNLLDPAARLNPDRPHLVIWPEAALPVFPDSRLQQTLYSRVGQWSARRQVPLLTGAVTRYDTAPALTVDPFRAQELTVTRPYYNSALLFDGHYQTQQYDRVHMLPVADQVPLVAMNPGEKVGISYSFGSGGARTIFRAGGSRFSTLIAYEVAFADHARRMVAEGAEFLTVISNPSAWIFPAAHRQLEAVARIRAIENRRAVVLASVSGGSGVILPDGRRGARADWGERTVVTAELPRHHGISGYTSSGDLIYRIGLFVALLLGFAYSVAVMFIPQTRGTGTAEAERRFGWSRFLE